MKIDFDQLPSNLFVYSIKHVHTPIRYKGDEHSPMYWEVALQHKPSGGRLTSVIGETPQMALDAAIDLYKEQHPDAEL